MTLAQDVRYGLRVLAKSRAYTVVVVATLALALGANTVIFSFVNLLLIRPLPIAEPDTLGWIFAMDPQRGTSRSRNSYPDYVDLREAAGSFALLAAATTDNVTLTGRGEPQRLQAQKVTANLFETWGLKPLIGRTLRPEEDAPGSACALVLSHKVWSAQFQGDASVLGRALTIDGRPCSVVGVLTPKIEFGNLSLVDVWMPIAADPALARRDDRRYSVVGRLRPGVSHAQADAEVRAVMARLAAGHPTTNAGWGARVAVTKEAIAGGDTWVVLALLGLVVGLVLVIACANVANLMLARAAARRRELAVRAALGATRWRVVRQLVTESLLLGIAGGALALAVAQGSIRLIQAAAYEPIFELVAIDRNVVIFAAALAFLAPLLFSLLPAVHSSAGDLGEALKEGARSGGTLRARRSRHALVVAQVSLALTLLVASTLVVRTMIHLNELDLGFDPAVMLTAQVEVPEWKYRTDAEVGRFYERLLPELQAIAGAEGAAAISGLPALSFGSRVHFSIDGRPEAAPGDRPWAQRFVASEDYFRTTGLILVRGRAFTRDDRAGGAAAAIVNAELARRYWKTPDAALGARIAWHDREAAAAWARIVGVVSNTSNPDIEAAPDPMLYVPLAQQPARAMALVVRAPRPEQLASALRAAVYRTDPEIAVFQLRTMDDALADELSSSNILTSMLAAFAVLALVLATTGLYGVMSYSVGQRAREIGVRVALGAVPGDIRRLVVGQAFRLVLIGGVLGLAGAAVLARGIGTLLYGVTPFDPTTYAGVVTIIVACAALASYVPARRAAHLDPVTSLRAE